MQQVHFQLHFKTGRTSINADALPRIPWDCILNAETVTFIINIIQSKEIPTFEAYVGSAMQLHKVEVKTYPNKMTLEQWQKTTIGRS